jgi:hypothetical protein
MAARASYEELKQQLQFNFQSSHVLDATVISNLEYDRW